MDDTAMTSAEPVDVTAIRIMMMMMNSPVRPSSFWATTTGTSPTNMNQNQNQIINSNINSIQY